MRLAGGSREGHGWGYVGSIMGIIVSSCLNENDDEAVVPVNRVRRVFYGIFYIYLSLFDFWTHRFFFLHQSPASPSSPWTLTSHIHPLLSYIQVFFSEKIFFYYWDSSSVLQGLKCPVCSKFILPDDIECHLVMCLTKPRLSYNGKLSNVTWEKRK